MLNITLELQQSYPGCLQAKGLQAADFDSIARPSLEEVGSAAIDCSNRQPPIAVEHGNQLAILALSKGFYHAVDFSILDSNAYLVHLGEVGFSQVRGAVAKMVDVHHLAAPALWSALWLRNNQAHRVVNGRAQL